MNKVPAKIIILISMVIIILQFIGELYVKYFIHSMEFSRFLSSFEIVTTTALLILLYTIVKILRDRDKNKKLEKKLQNLISQNIIMSKTDADGIITDVTEAFCAKAGYTRDELVGQPHSIVRHPDTPKEVFEDLWKTIKNKKIYKLQIKNLNKNGESYYLDSVISPIFDEKGDILNFLGIASDISNKVALEELNQNQKAIIESQTKLANMQRDNAIKSLNVKTEFLANMSHEIRTPLNAILGFVDILRSNEKDEESLRYLKIINNSSHHLHRIINDILDLGKIENGKMEIENIAIKIKKEANDVINLFSAKCSQKNINMSLVINNDVPAFIKSDPTRLKQVIGNLVSNATKFTDSGKSITLKVDYKDDKLHIAVKDEGKGIAKDKLQSIFKAFSQEDNTTTRKYGGTGLGLSISSLLIKLMGGELKVKSTLGVGSEFYFDIPAKITKKAPKEYKNKNKNIHLSGHILLVEDNETNQEFMKIILRMLGFTFDVANDGLEAIESFEKNRYDCILMDENMPNLSGIKAAKRIFEIEKEKDLPHTPIIALTANALSSDKKKFMDAGMDEYLSKPIDKKKLGKVMGDILGEANE
jgi:PAS domain S-box-containing protein